MILRYIIIHLLIIRNIVIQIFVAMAHYNVEMIWKKKFQSVYLYYEYMNDFNEITEF